MFSAHSNGLFPFFASTICPSLSASGCFINLFRVLHFFPSLCPFVFPSAQCFVQASTPAHFTSKLNALQAEFIFAVKLTTAKMLQEQAAGILALQRNTSNIPVEKYTFLLSLRPYGVLPVWFPGRSGLVLGYKRDHPRAKCRKGGRHAGAGHRCYQSRQSDGAGHRGRQT